MKQPKWEGGLGFWNLHAFNMAMLAKHGWRLIQNPNSLFAQPRSAKYYMNGNVLHAREVDAMSYMCRSVLKGIKLLTKV
jgi:hypothetical protein